MPASSEIGYLWSSYYAETMSVCFLKSYVAQSKDPDIHAVLQRALDVSSQRVKAMKDIYNSINHPIPEAFNDKDVDSNAKQLFSESFTLLYTRLMHQDITINYSFALSASSRSDFRNFFIECLNTSIEIRQKVTEVLVAKGLLSKYPNIPIPDRVDFVHDKSYFGSNIGSIIGMKRRPLNAIEISHIYSLMETKLLLRTLYLGYSQVVKSGKIRGFLSECKQISDKQLKKLGSFLADEDISQPSIREILVTESKESPVSDKLILCHITAVTAYIISYYGLYLTNTARLDLTSTYRNFVTELLELSKSGGDLMIEAGWLERIPQAADRQELIQH
jgi:spore coat protein CotF